MRSRLVPILRGVGFLALFAVSVLLAAAGALQVLDELLRWAPVATSSGQLAGGIALIAAGSAAFALVPAVIPWRISDVAVRTLLVVFGGGAALLLAGALAATAAIPGCDGWRPDWERWRVDASGEGSDAAVSIAAGLARCGTLDGASRAEVRRLLGPPQRGAFGHARNQWRWHAGIVNDFMGPGDGEHLTVRFVRDRVTETGVDYGD